MGAIESPWMMVKAHNYLHNFNRHQHILVTRKEASNDVKMCVIFQFCVCVIEMRQFFIIQENKQTTLTRKK